MKYIYIETYGCSANLNNSEIIKGILKQAGYEVTNNEKIADILIINTCVVKGKTQSKIIRRIQDLSNQYKTKPIIVSGCMAETDRNSLKKLNSRLIFLGINHIKDIVKLIKDYRENKLSMEKQQFYLDNNKEEKLCLPKIPENKLISIIQISQGCNGECSYCKTRFAKGSLSSYPKEKIISSIESDLKSGAKEIWLTSQDCASYGLDNKKHNLPSLLQEILNLNHNFKLRLGMSNPNNIYSILQPLIEIFNNPKVYKFLHIPIQSASDKILEDMNRNYKINVVEEIINSFKKKFPDITIATDIITGYPTESEQDHKFNIDFIKQHRPDVLNLAKFSSHKQTKAGKLKQHNIKVINKRAAELMDLHRKTAEENKQKFKNKIVKVFVNKKISENLYESRDENYNIVLINSNDKSILGKNIQVKIKDTGVHHMVGEIIEE